MANASESKPLLTSLPNDDNEDNEDAVEVWIIGWTRRDHQIYVNDDRIVLSSLCEPTLELIFTPYRWIQFVASIQLSSSRLSSTLQCFSNWMTDILSDLSQQERY